MLKRAVLIDRDFKAIVSGGKAHLIAPLYKQPPPGCGIESLRVVPGSKNTWVLKNAWEGPNGIEPSWVAPMGYVNDYIWFPEDFSLRNRGTRTEGVVYRLDKAMIWTGTDKGLYLPADYEPDDKWIPASNMAEKYGRFYAQIVDQTILPMSALTTSMMGTVLDKPIVYTRNDDDYIRHFKEYWSEAYPKTLYDDNLIIQLAEIKLTPKPIGEKTT